MVTTADVLIGTAVVAGAALCVLGYASYSRWDEPGSTLFGVYAALWGGMPLLDVGYVALFGSGTIAGLYWVVAVAFWFLFALRYTGREFHRWTLIALFAPLPGLFPWLYSVTVGDGVPLFEALGILIFAYYTALGVVGALLVLQATSRYGHISPIQGGLLAVAGLLPPAAMNTFGIFSEQVSEAVLFAVYAAGVVGVLLAVGLALFRYDVFDATPAAGIIGERAIARETDDLIAITDDDGEVITRNETANRTLPSDEAEAVGKPIAGSFGVDIDALRARETVELRTERGVRKFDPQVTALTDQHGRRTGTMVSLRDVTDREIRRQRLEVLNRFVRHNLRNQASIITANTEAVADELSDERLLSHLGTATDAVDSLTDVGQKAKTVEGLLGRDAEPTAVDVRAFLDEFAADADGRWPDVTVTACGTRDVTVETDTELLDFALENVVEAMIEHAEGTVSAVEVALAVDRDTTAPVTVEISDDGQGLPDSEIEVIEAGTETPMKHGSGVGLWVANWAIRELGGELAFEDAGSPDGTVKIALPREQLSDALER